MNFDENRWRKSKVTPEWGRYQKKNFRNHHWVFNITPISHINKEH